MRRNFPPTGVIAMDARQWRRNTEKDEQICSGQGVGEAENGMCLVQKMKRTYQTFSQIADSALIHIRASVLNVIFGFIISVKY